MSGIQESTFMTYLIVRKAPGRSGNQKQERVAGKNDKLASLAKVAE